MKIDGVLDEAEWDEADSISEFYIVSPYTLEPAKNKTEVKIFTNEEGVYVGFINPQKPSQWANINM